MSADQGSMDSRGRISCGMFTPLPPLPTGVATYSLRLLRITRDIIDWTVFHAEGSDAGVLPSDIRAVPIRGTAPEDLPQRRVFMLGNSPECFEVACSLLRFGGCGVFHETVMHHMLRFCFLRDGRRDLYQKLLGFEYGPRSRTVEKLLSRSMPEPAYDSLLKEHPLIGSLVHASDPIVCLNESAADFLRRTSGGRCVFVAGHPLDPAGSFTEPVDAAGGTYVGMVGGGHPGRNLHILLEALHMVRSSGRDVRCALVGGGWPSDLPGWAIATGRLDDASYQGWIRSLSVAVDIRHPTCNETSGSLLEVMRAGIPPVLTASGSFTRIPSGAAVRIPAPPSPHALAKAVMMILDDPSLAGSLSSGARLHAAKESSVDRARSEWTRIVSTEPEPSCAAPYTTSLSAAIHDPPPGFERHASIEPGPVSWSFEGTLSLDPPPWTDRCLLTASGTGRAGSETLSREPRVFDLRGKVVLEGEGRVYQATWIGGE